ncbi:hypothetical protein BU14_1139s0003 [Porphyra umbilicalis]|uniref:Uncharacterized protein n=1 Tax=Porphyra umbilicalis TaxID=2786 RepID=A0A1X6NN74_PORUM|nr:hypothetical protein BU14_1139s0003 [Porphyra umbilicalis]|eukprot:OSX69803.1 hypothetical protein BU14_1139s0003 [Porphyra umbilicalis]
MTRREGRRVESVGKGGEATATKVAGTSAEEKTSHMPNRTSSQTRKSEERKKHKVSRKQRRAPRQK